MRSLVICGPGTKANVISTRVTTTIDLHGVPVRCCLLKMNPPRSSLRYGDARNHVRIQVKAFSCNYRDLVLIFRSAVQGQANGLYAIGSEFVGEVVETGPEVTDLKVGDLVVADNAKDVQKVIEGDGRQGLATNQASREFLVLPEAKLFRVPFSMPIPTAAAFSLGAQTAYSMVRQLEIRFGSRVLVMAGRSNTSLFVLSALRKFNADVFVLTRSRHFPAENWTSLGASTVIINNSNDNGYSPELAELVDSFDYVIDPFCDLYLPLAVRMLGPGGRYISCGVCCQYQPIVGQTFSSNHAFSDVFAKAITKGLQFTFNSLGLTDDLRRAVDDYIAGHFKVVIDHIYPEEAIGEFLLRTYCAEDRFGKVVLQYQ